MNHNSNTPQHLKKALIGGFKGLISSIPYIGSFAVGTWDGYWDSRAHDFIEKLNKNLLRINEEKIDKNYLQTEEFADLFIRSLRTRLQSRSEKKAQFILGMLIDSMHKDRNARFSVSVKETFLLILDQLSEEEMDFLYKFSQDKYLNKTKNDIYQMSDHEAISIDGLLSKGVLRENDTWKKEITKSMLGREFIDYLQVLALQ